MERRRKHWAMARDFDHGASGGRVDIDSGSSLLVGGSSRPGKDGWTLEAKIKNVRRVGDPTRYCVANKC